MPNQDELKSKIRKWIKQNKSVRTAFGDLAVQYPGIGEGGNALVFPVSFEGE